MITKSHLAALLASLALSSIAPAAATIGSLSTVAGTPSGGHDYFGQTFLVPATETGISSASLLIRQGNITDSPATLYIYNYDLDTNTFTGSPLYSFPTLIPASTNEFTLTTAPNLPVTPGQSLALVLDWGTTSNSPGNVGTYYQTTSYYPDGYLLFAGALEAPVAFTNYDAPFEVQFGAIPEPATALTTAALVTLSTLTRRRRA